jgi:DNA-binding NarL/FixJ family response regulator
MAPRIRILVADDHAIIRHGLKDILERHFPRVIVGEAENGTAALALVRQGRWDAVVLDIGMPGQSGLDVLGELAGTKAAPPVLMLSMHAEAQYARRVMKMGASGYVTKIKAPLTIVEAVKCVLSGGKYFGAGPDGREPGLSKSGSQYSLQAGLSRRELQVLGHMAAGKAQKEIAADLDISSQTVSTHRARILRKLGGRSTADLIRFALANNLVE